MTDAADDRIDASVVAGLYVQHGQELLRFLMGVLRDTQLAHDVLQVAFARMLERGHEAQEGSRKAWLFRVAYHEALAVKRRAGVTERALRDWAVGRSTSSEDAERPLLRGETLHAVREALAQLPAEQRAVVHKRIYEEKTFAEIARELGIPLGTALWRMRAAVEKLRDRLRALGG